MKPPHDMGGNPSEPIIPDKPDDPKFSRKSWHRRVLGITIAMGAMGAWSIDASRYARESLPRLDYSNFSYYEKWLGGLTNLLFQRGFINKNEIQSGSGDSKAPLKLRQKVLSATNVGVTLAAGAPTRRDGPEPIFSIGQKVCAKLPFDTLSNKKLLDTGFEFVNNLETCIEEMITKWSFKKFDKNKPVILMGYYNMIFQYGENEFLRKCKISGVNGLIVVDLPWPENKKFASKCKKRSIFFIQLLSPTTTKNRLKKIIKDSHEMIYFISMLSTTGGKLKVSSKEILSNYDKIKKINSKKML